MRALLFVALCSLVASCPAFSQSAPAKVDNAAIGLMIERFKEDPRGPYRDIRWFCPDGTTVAPSERCPTRGVQRARYKDDVIALGASNHVFLGQILATTEHDRFWDAGHGNSRLKQYQLEKYLRQIDNGWVNRKAQSYRGAYQAEDEDSWGLEFLRWVAQDNNRLESQFFLIRQAVKDIPHRADDNLSQRVRTTSKEIADAYPPFANLRVKIHGQPDELDASRVTDFRSAHEGSIPSTLNPKFDQLIGDLDLLFSPATLNDVKSRIAKLPQESPNRAYLSDQFGRLESETAPSVRTRMIAEAALHVRRNVTSETRPSTRLTLLDISARLEEMLLATAARWTPVTLEDQLDKIQTLLAASAGFGLLELWEYDQAAAELTRTRGSGNVDLHRLTAYLDQARRAVEWGSLTVRASYEEVVSLYTGFEPLAVGFYDEKIRASILLPMGASVGRLGDFVAGQAGLRNEILGIQNQAHARGLNPGFAKGELVVVPGDPESVAVESSKIYVFNRPPADLKPVAGILTVTEGNLVSHVQLLARNLGIPNGVVSASNLNDLREFAGDEVFMAVSNNGTILMKPVADMTDVERRLFEVRQRSENRITVPVGRMDLDSQSVLNLAGVDATDSGVLTGPKAANLGQLKQMFPDNVVEGLVIPFGIFRRHMDQPMPGSDGSYWDFLTATFNAADSIRESGSTDADIETYVLGRLETMRNRIREIQLDPAFVEDFRARFSTVLGGRLGTVPVFIRSDTNMEDLKDFTGAGLNLTLFNVLDEATILQGIKNVWASPYSERSFRWRQRYLLNPENVFPSILVIPSVNADYSGVLITKGVTSGLDDDVTVAFNRGVGGAVDGQLAESWLLKSTGRNLLLSPAREVLYTAIPAAGGTTKPHTTFHRRILSNANLAQLRTLSASIKDRLPRSPGIETTGPFDVELGFKDDKIWLFQVRPFVENKQALGSEYLHSISPAVDGQKKIALDARIG